MVALGDRIVILIIGLTGLAGLFAFRSGFLEGHVGGQLEWVLRGALVALFLLIVLYLWRRSRMTDPTK